MAKGDQVLRFGVGTPDSPRSVVWRLWVPRDKSDVYISHGALGSHFKVSLHASGPWRVALTSEYVRRPERNIVLEGPDPRGAREWDRPAPQPGTAPFTQAFNIVVPWFEIRDRPRAEKGEVVWAEEPPEGSCVEFTVIFAPSGLEIDGHPGARAMNSKLVGEMVLANGERVFVVRVTHAMDERLIAEAERLRGLVDAAAKTVEGLHITGFGLGTGVASFIDVTYS